MGIKCKLFGCGEKVENFIYGGAERTCKKCGQVFVWSHFYPNHDSLWLEKEFIHKFKDYESMCKMESICPDCDKYTNKCTCNSC